MVFKQVFRIAFITFIWKQYKTWIVSSILLLTCLYLIAQIHTDFLHHWELQQDNSQTGKSFIIKWLAYIGSISLYCLYHFFRPKRKPLPNDKKNKDQQKELNAQLKSLSADKDPFASIRARKTLRNRSDFILKSNSINLKE